MTPQSSNKLIDGASCKVVGGTHAGKSGSVTDIKTSKTGHITITGVQKNGIRFKTLAKNVVVGGKSASGGPIQELPYIPSELNPMAS